MDILHIIGELLQLRRKKAAVHVLGFSIALHLQKSVRASGQIPHAILPCLLMQKDGMRVKDSSSERSEIFGLIFKQKQPRESCITRLSARQPIAYAMLLNTAITLHCHRS